MDAQDGPQPPAREPPVHLNPDKFKAALAAKRAQRRKRALNDPDGLHGKLPLTVDFRVGDARYRHFTSDVVLATSSRFVYSVVDSGEIALDPADVPAAEIALDILANEPPKALTIAQLVDVIQSLSYMSASDALDAFDAYLPEPMDADTVTGLLAGVIKFCRSSSLEESLH